MKLVLERKGKESWRACLESLLQENELEEDELEDALDTFDLRVDQGESSEVAAFKVAFLKCLLVARGEAGEVLQYFAEDDEDEDDVVEPVFTPHSPPQIWDLPVVAWSGDDGTVWLKADRVEIQARTLEDLQRLGESMTPTDRKELVDYFRHLGCPVTRIIRMNLAERLDWVRDTMKHVGFPYAGDEDRVVTLRREEPADLESANG